MLNLAGYSNYFFSMWTVHRSIVPSIAGMDCYKITSTGVAEENSVALVVSKDPKSRIGSFWFACGLRKKIIGLVKRELCVLMRHFVSKTQKICSCKWCVKKHSSFVSVRRLWV